MSGRRVVITGAGVITAIGGNREAYWAALAAGANGVRRISLFDCSTFPVQSAAEVHGLDGDSLGIDLELPKPVQIGLLTAEEAVHDAKLVPGTFDPTRAGTIFSTSHSGYPVDQIEDMYPLLERYATARTLLLDPTNSMVAKLRSSLYKGPATTAVLAAKRYGLRGYTANAHTACATGNQAIGDAFLLVARGDQDVMLAGSAAASVNPFGIASFALINALSTTNDTPEKASRPFDRRRNGFVLGEGGAVLVVEELAHALTRHAHIYAEIIGYGVSLDTFGIAEMDPEATGATRSMERALTGAGIGAEDIDYINAHGTSTLLNDKTETLAIKNVFGARAYQIPISSTKSMIGHLLSGAGSTEMVAALLALERNVVHPTINYEFPDPECDLDYVPNVARGQHVRTLLSNSFGFGGQNSCVVVRRFEG